MGQQCTSVEANRVKIKRTTKQKMDGLIEEDLRRVGVTKCGKTAGRERMTQNIAAVEEPNGGIADISWTMNT